MVGNKNKKSSKDEENKKCNCLESGTGKIIVEKKGRWKVQIGEEREELERSGTKLATG